MEPVGLAQPRGKGLAVVHRCVVCGIRRVNKVAMDTRAPDDIDVVSRLPPV